MSAGLALAALLVWIIVLSLPWRPWSVRERLEADPGCAGEALDDVSVLIPARNEADAISTTLESLARQGTGLDILVVDDQSSDGTGEVARRCGVPGVRVITGAELPEGWTGKVWAQAQARAHIERPLVLLLDADIALAPGLVGTLRRELHARGAALASLMAELAMKGFWERLLLPAFVYFFKLIYPFRVSNSASRRVAAAAGGCVLLELRALDAAGGFESLKDAIIDDCTLARRVKDAGFRTWIGLTRSVTSHRRYRGRAGLGDIWAMVTRTAFTLVMTICFAAPAVLVFSPDPIARAGAVGAWLAMWIAYLPTLRYYGRAPIWGLAMPAIGVLFLAMTWDSARRFMSGERSAWRGRRYAAGRLPAPR